MTPNDPLTLTYNKIIEIFARYGVNAISWNSTRSPQKDSLTTADFPEVQVRPSFQVTVLGSSSSTTDITLRCDIGVNSGDQRLGESYFPLLWRITQALHAMKYAELEEILWKERPFVTDVLIEGGTTGLAAQVAENRGIEGWSGVTTIQVMMSFNREDMEPKI